MSNCSDAAPTAHLDASADQYEHYGYRKVEALLKVAGRLVNIKRIYPTYGGRSTACMTNARNCGPKLVKVDAMGVNGVERGGFTQLGNVVLFHKNSLMKKKSKIMIVLVEESGDMIKTNYIYIGDEHRLNTPIK